MSTERKPIDFSKYYYINLRWSSRWSGRIMKITRLAEDGPPQRIFGYVIDVNTGLQYETLRDDKTEGCIFAGDVGEQVPQEKLEVYIRALHERIDAFFAK